MHFFFMHLGIFRMINPGNRVVALHLLFFPFYVFFFFKFLYSILSPCIILFFDKSKHSCRFIRYLFDDDKNANTCSEKCIKIKKALRFGNAMIQLLNVIQLAKVTGMANVFFPKNFLMQQKSFQINGINFIPINSSAQLNCYAQIFYERSKKLPKLPFYIDSHFKEHFHKSLYTISIPNDSLVIHIRSGDVFTRHFNINFKYGQPPCSYYLDAINMKNWSKIIIVSEDSFNPCVRILSKMFGLRFQPHNLTTDLSILLNAPNLVLSRGSFGYAIVLLSQKLKNLFTFNQSSSKIPDHFNCIPTNDYYNSVIKYWKKSRSQKKKLIKSKCLKWEFIPKGPQNTNNFIHDVNL